MTVTAAGQVFDGHDSATLAAMLERMFPAEDGSPGASKLGVPGFVEALLSAELASRRDDYAVGLAALERLAQETKNASFADLEPRSQDELLTAFDDPDVQLGGESAMNATEFVDLVNEHLYEGVLGDPSYGGNKDGLGWKLIGFPGPRRVVTAAEQDLDAEPTMVSSSTYDDEFFKKKDGDR